jgi:predicted phage terminase large subunit-like protein
MHVPGPENYAAEGLWNHNTGKTWVGANWIVEQAASAAPGTMYAVVAPTFRDARVTCFEGPSGILKAVQPGEAASWHRNELRLELTGGGTIYGYSGDQPERLRGANLAGAWVDELGSFRYPQTWYEALIPALRMGEHPRVVVTTTPRVTPLIRDLAGRTDGSVHITRGSTWENAGNLSSTALDELRRRYEGTRLGRQELEGELLEDVEGALWSRSDIDAARAALTDVPDLTRIVVAIDPAVTSGEDSDETGIVVAGEAKGGHGYVLADLSMRGTPDACMRRAVSAYYLHNADCIVAEVNNGGDYIRDLLRTVDPQVPYRSVHASRGKATRAEPVSALYEQHRIHHVGSLPDLEDQMCLFVPGQDHGHDDRVDSLVWCITELRGLSAGSWTEAYGARVCPSCGRSSARGDGTCPFCGKPLT